MQLLQILQQLPPTEKHTLSHTLILTLSFPLYMKDWLAELDDFGKRYGKGILSDSGNVSHKAALEKAELEYEKYRRKTVDELSPTERDFLESIKSTQKKLENNKLKQ
jgi:hypothetical protein